MDRIRGFSRHRPTVLIGGPPCQGFSISIRGGPYNRDPKDPRNSLFMEFARFLRAFQPTAFVIENVKGLLTSRTEHGDPVIDIITKELSECGYHLETSVLDGCEYGVPQQMVKSENEHEEKQKIWKIREKGPSMDSFLVWDQYLRCFWKQSLQYTGFPVVGLKGTSVSFPQSEQVALCISLGPPKFPRLT